MRARGLGDGVIITLKGGWSTRPIQIEVRYRPPWHVARLVSDAVLLVSTGGRGLCALALGQAFELGPNAGRLGIS